MTVLALLALAVIRHRPTTAAFVAQAVVDTFFLAVGLYGMRLSHPDTALAEVAKGYSRYSARMHRRPLLWVWLPVALVASGMVRSLVGLPGVVRRDGVLFAVLWLGRWPMLALFGFVLAVRVWRWPTEPQAQPPRA